MKKLEKWWPRKQARDEIAKAVTGVIYLFRFLENNRLGFGLTEKNMRCVENSTIIDLLRGRAQHFPEAAAIRAPDRAALTYGGLLVQVESAAEFFNIRGIRRSDRIAVVLPNGPEMASAFFCVSASAVCSPLNAVHSPNEFDSYFSCLNPKALIVQSGVNSAAIGVAENRGIPVIELLPNLDAGAGTFELKTIGRATNSRGDHPQADDVALILPTSGTTSHAKLVPLTHANLLTSACNIAATLQLTEADRCLNVMPLFHIHGIVGALLSSVVAGASVICTPGFDAEKFLPWLETLAPTWYTAVPTMHHAVLSRVRSNPELVKGHALRFIRSSSSAMPVRVIQELEEQFRVPVIEAYGMTEAAHQMTSNPLPPGQRKLGSVGMAAGPEVLIMDEVGNVLSPGRAGEIVIRGAHVISGYLNSPESAEENFERGWFRTGDQGYLDTDGYLFITGRLKEMINRGGEKIAPREVEDVILHHRAVAEAIAFAVPHETLGQDVAVAVVLRENATVTEKDLQRFVAAQLSEFKIPRRVLFVDEIPKSATGKPQRAGFAEKLGPLLLWQRVHKFVAPQTQAEKTLAAIWSQVLGIERIGVQDNFFALGGDSLRATLVISRVRQAFQIEFPLRSLFEMQTVRQLAMAITEIQGGTHPGALGDLLPDIKSLGVRR